MKHLFLTAFIAIFGVYALGLTGIIDMQPATHTEVAATNAPLSFTERVVANNQTHNSHKARTSGDYTLKAMR